MKPTLLSGIHLPRLASAACLLIWSSQIHAATPYREETHGPRIGTRILLFFKDIAYGDNPGDRYRHLPKNQPQATPRQHSYGAQPPGTPRYNLDQPPAAAYPQQRPSAPAQNLPPHAPAPVPQDMPYASPEPVQRDERESPQAGIGGQQEDLPQVTIKPKSASPAPKPAPAPISKPPVEEPAPKSTPPVSSEPPQTALSASTTVAASKKSWQGPATEPPPTSPPVSTTPPTPPVESKPVANTDTTLTGSKTSKDGRVKSPYPPYNELDVSGLPTGSLAMDPTTGKVFRVP